MLKHIIILLTAALGYYAQAYPLQWQLSNVSSSSSSGDHKLTKDSQYYAFLFLTEYDYLQANTIGKTYAKTSVETVCNQIENGSIDNFNKLYAYYTGNSYTTDGTAAFSGQSSSSDWGSATKLSAFVVILDAASLSKASHYMVAECNGEQVLSVYYQTKKELSLDFGSQAGNEWVEIVPEPSSGLLLVLGIATLALRRERGTYTVPNSLRQ